MSNHVIVCGRCGEQNRIDGDRCEEEGWVYLNPSYLQPLDAAPRGFFVLTHFSHEPQHVCPACQTDEERPTAERWSVITCVRCGRQSRGRLDEHGGETEWEEPGWAFQQAAAIQPMDEPDTVVFVLGSYGHVCPGCQTGEESAGLFAEAPRW